MAEEDMVEEDMVVGAEDNSLLKDVQRLADSRSACC
jgi:hypothetical protein